MTADPKAPGAAAVYLNIEEVTSDQLHYQSFYARIKVLTEKGKELATVDVPPYLRGTSKITDIKARTIHSDGTVIPLVGKPQDLLVVKGKTREGDQMQVNRKVFTLPSVEVGSILEYTYQIQDDDNISSSPHWEIQRPYFVHKAHYLFTPFKAFLPGIENQTNMYMEDEHGRVINSLIWWSKLPEGVSVKTDAAGHYSVDVVDVPPAPDEDWMPPIQSLIYRVFFYYKAAYSGTDYWVSEAKLWSKDVDQFARPSKAIKDAVSGLIAPADSDLDKAKKLYKAVQALDNTDYSRKKTDSEMKQLHLKTARHAEDVWAQKSGDSEDIALLYLAMLRAVGLKAWPMQVVDRSRAIFDHAYLSTRQFDDFLAIVVIDGKEIYLDPGEKMCPFGTLHWKHTLTSGFRLSDKGVVIEDTPDSNNKDTLVQKIADISIDADGGVKGEARVVMTGQEALYWRQLALQNDEEEVKKQFIESLRDSLPDGVQAGVDHFVALDDSNANLIAVLKISGNIGAAAGKHLIFPAFFFESRAKHPFVAQKKRITSVDLHYAKIEHDDVTYHVPSGYDIESAPESSQDSWLDHATLQIAITSKEDSFEVERILTPNFHMLNPSEYDDLHDFYLRLATADQQQLVFTRASAAKGIQ
jgi:hypothetical protein